MGYPNLDIPNCEPSDKVYVAGPYSSAPEENTERAIEVADKIRGMGFTPYIPHLCHFWDEQNPHDYQYWLMHCLRILSDYDHLVRFSGDSPGAETEVSLCDNLDIPTHAGFENFRESVLRDGRIFCIVGPSGIGKSSIVDVLCEEIDTVQLVCGYSSRDIRDGEEQGNPYYFVSEEEMLEKEKNGDFVEFVEHAGNYYGLTEQEFVSAIEKTLVPFCVVTRDGVNKLKKHFGPEIDVTSIGILPDSDGDSYELFAQHAVKRGRGELFAKQLSDARSCQYTVRNTYDGGAPEVEIRRCAQQIMSRILNKYYYKKNFLISTIDKNIYKEEGEFKIEYKKEPDLQAERWHDLKKE